MSVGDGSVRAILDAVDAASGVHSGLQASLRTARRTRDAPATRALRSALTAIANAEAVASPVRDTPSEGPIAGAVVGVGAGDVARRVLTDADIDAIMRAEIDERVAAAAEYERHGQTAPAASLRDEIEVLERHLDPNEDP